MVSDRRIAGEPPDQAYERKAKQQDDAADGRIGE
jgi:hypothetical protein